MAYCREFNQVFITYLVHCQKRYVGAVVFRILFPVMPAVGSQVCFHADNRLNPCFHRRFVKLERAVHNTVVGEGNGRHIVFLRFFYEFWDFDESVEQRIFTVDMEVNKVGHRVLLLYRKEF